MNNNNPEDLKNLKEKYPDFFNMIDQGRDLDPGAADPVRAIFKTQHKTSILLALCTLSVLLNILSLAVITIKF